MLDLFAHPFMLRALLSGALLAALLAALGVFVTLRKMAFFSDGIAHASLAGIAIAVLAGLAPLPLAIAWAAAVAVIIWKLERDTRLPSDTIIGIFFTASMALHSASSILCNGALAACPALSTRMSTAPK